MKVSVVIPVYNAEQYLSSCLESLLRQTYSDFEAIVIDDGSTDSSLKILEEYEKKDNRIFVFHQNNSGVSSARNRGIEYATGEYLYFMDADDELFEDAIHKLVCSIESGMYDMSMCGYKVYDFCGENTYSIEQHHCCSLSPEEAMRMMFVPKHYRYLGYLFIKLFRTDIIKQNNIFLDNDIFFNEDRLFTIKYLSCCKNKTIYDTTPIYKYILRESGAMSSLNNSKVNPKFITDFDAQYRIHQIIKSKTQNDELILLSEKCLVNSFLNISKYLWTERGKYKNEILRIAWYSYRSISFTTLLSGVKQEFMTRYNH